MTTGNKRRALVTGATEGIGLACASALVRAGVQVLLVGRSTAKGERAMAAAPLPPAIAGFMPPIWRRPTICGACLMRSTPAGAGWILPSIMPVSMAPRLPH
ncbi:hypothetical protein SODG_000750 [Sodalis praecaptivus]